MRPRLLFMGTPGFAVPSLSHLVKAGFPVVGVVTQMDKPRGRGYREAPSPVKLAAQDLGLTILQVESINHPDFLDLLSELGPEVIVVAAFGQILKGPLLAWPTLGCINLHASLLPKYRGAAPVQWTLAQGETATGVTVQKMAERVDAGDILVQRGLAVGPLETAPELTARLAALGGPTLAEALELLGQSGGHAGTPQDEAQATQAPRLSREDGKLDWNWNGEMIHNRVRGFNPWPGTFTSFKGARLKILATRPATVTAPADTPPGTLLPDRSEQAWLVAAGGGTTVWVDKVQGENANVLSAQAFACGYHIERGDRLE